MSVGRSLVLFGGLALFIGARLTWMSVPALFGVSGPSVQAIEIGWEDNGYVTGAVGSVLLLIGILRRPPCLRPYSVPASLLAGVALLEVAGCFLRILQINPEAGFFHATKVGMYVSLLGALLALAGGLSSTPPVASETDAPSAADLGEIQPISL